jgi:hypothetical protein
MANSLSSTSTDAGAAAVVLPMTTDAGVAWILQHHPP